MVSVGWSAVVQSQTAITPSDLLGVAEATVVASKTHCVAYTYITCSQSAGNVHKLPQIVSLCKRKNNTVHLNPTLIP